MNRAFAVAWSLVCAAGGGAAGWYLHPVGGGGFVGPPQLIGVPAADPPTEKVRVVVRTVREPNGQVDCVGDATATASSVAGETRRDHSLGLQWPVGVGGPATAWRDIQVDGSWRLGNSNWHVTGHVTPVGAVGLGLRRDF